MLLRILGGLILLVVAAAAVLLWLSRPVETGELRDTYLTGEDRYVTAAGLDWRVRESGPENAPALILIHGFSHSLEAFDPWAAELDDAYRVIRFDLPGHGLTGRPADGAYSNEATVEQVSALLDEIAPETFALGGNSLGGLVAWRYAAGHPERVGALVLVSPGGYSINGVTADPVPVPQGVAFYLRTAPEAGVRAATAALYADPARLDERDVSRITDLMKREGNGEAMVQRLEVFTLPDPEPVLAQIETPALILWGEQDMMVPPAHGPRFVEAMPDARLITYPDAGHVAMEERPEATASDVRAFLDEVWQ
ncbi:alpha/beta hydrolase [Marinicauda pacifica]|uniref:Alpha/beta hydrolase n=1 Tax=Marinicauda pacifica TaxID=1133559 RepID=A0A4S2HFN4_9PROT|nr:MULTISPECIES: alpha/beta hydrolase [Marinicauda]TGY94638.1 alpha/beta hydrolase [Marinicauda pacifica]GGE37554.1 alpha/beta hydrolase [Marinicauda pacifica]